MKYNFCYKYYKLKNKDTYLIIQLSYDNTMKRSSYLAATNIVFKDNEGDLGHAGGSGENEMNALNMCVKDINEYFLSSNEYNLKKLAGLNNLSISDFEEIKLPYCVTFVLGNNKYTTVYFKNEKNNLIVLTAKTKLVMPIIKNEIYTLEKNMRKIKNSDDKKFTKEYLKENDFYPTFNNLTM